MYVFLVRSSGNAPCIRCFHLQLKSRYVLRVLTEGLDKCYSSDAAAERSCPDPEPDSSLDMSQRQRRFVHLLLYSKCCTLPTSSRTSRAKLHLPPCLEEIAAPIPEHYHIILQCEHETQDFLRPPTL